MLMNDIIGRKHSIMISAIPSTAGFLMMAAAKEMWLLLLGRFFTGISAGITSSSIPVGTFQGMLFHVPHFCEHSPTIKRGASGDLAQSLRNDRKKKIIVLSNDTHIIKGKNTLLKTHY